jgi:hypothetical protein
LERESLIGLLSEQYIKYIFCQYKNEVVKRIFLSQSRAIYRHI